MLYGYIYDVQAARVIYMVAYIYPDFLVYTFWI